MAGADSVNRGRPRRLSGSQDSVICGDRKGGPGGVLDSWTTADVPFLGLEVVTWVCLLCDDSVGFFVPFSLCLLLRNSLKKKFRVLSKAQRVVGPPRMERLHSHHPERRRAQGCYLVCSKEVKKSGISCTRERRVVLSYVGG